MDNVSINDFSKLSDEDLAKSCKNDDRAYSELISRYLKTVRAIAARASNNSFDADDLSSEGLLGLFSAIKTFNPKHRTSFSTYARTCIQNKIYDAAKKSGRITDKTSSFDDNLDEQEDDDYSPDKIYLQKEISKEMFKKIASVLSELELSVLKLYILDESYENISKSLGVSVKSVDNAVQRIKKKLRSALL